MIDRVVKFKAWFKGTFTESPKMLYNVEHGTVIDNGIHGMETISFGNLLVDERFIVMQYTGLQDTKGNLIYEHDIVDLNGHRYKVYYCKGSFRLASERNDYVLSEWVDCCSVVGNEFEEEHHEKLS